MRAIDFALVLIALGAAAPAPQKPESAARPAAEAQDSASEIAASLREKCKLQSCTVTYRMTREGKATNVRISYRAPAALAFRVLTDEGSTRCWARPDRWVIQAEGRNGFVADMNPAEMFASDVYDVLAEEFPSDDVQDSDLGPGGELSLRLHPDKPLDNGRYIEFGVIWRPVRKHPLDWIARPEEWDDARVEEKLLVHEYPSGARFTLSRESGWPVEMMHPTGSRLELVDYSTSVEDSDFEIPPPAEGLKNVTEEFARNSSPAMQFLQRSTVYSKALRAFREKSYESQAIHEKVAKAFKVKYAPEVRKLFATWSEQCGSSIDQFVAWCRTRLEQIGDDPKSRAEFDAGVAEWKTGFVKNLTDAIDEHVAKIPSFVDPKQSTDKETLDPELVAELLVTERAAAREAFQLEVATLLLAKFDSDLRAIGALK